MQTQFIEQSLENGKKFTDISSAMFKTLVQQQLDVVTSYVETAGQHSSKLSEVKRVQDFWAVQAQFLQEANKIAMGNARSNLDTMVEAKNQFANWYEDSLKMAVAK